MSLEVRYATPTPLGLFCSVPKFSFPIVCLYPLEFHANANDGKVDELSELTKKINRMNFELILKRIVTGDEK